MQHHNVSIVDVAQHRFFNGGGAVGGPVLGIHRPVEDRKTPDFGHLPHRIAAAAPRGTEELGHIPSGQQSLAVGKLLGNVPAAHILHGFVAVAVKADFVPLVHHPLGDVRVLLHPVAAQQERGLHPTLLKPVQQRSGKPAGGAVIKGQRHIFLPAGSLGRQRQKSQA